MYVGILSNFFYKQKTWISQHPKYDQKENIYTYLDISGKVFRFNDSTGKLTFYDKKQEELNFSKTLNKFNRLNTVLYKPKIINNQNINNNYKDSSLNTDNQTSMSSRYFLNKDYFNLSPNNINDNNNNNDINNFKNSHSIESEHCKTNFNSKYKDYIKSYNIKNISSNIKSIKSKINSNTYNLSTNSNSLKISKDDNSLKINNYKYKKNNLYYKTESKKHIKPNIVFGHIIPKSLSIKDKKKSKINKKREDMDNNLFFLMERQHHNNISGEGLTNDKIYYKIKNDTNITKSFKDQLFKDKILNGLKKKYQFYNYKNNKEIKVPIITHQNYCFYKGYTFSDKKREPIYQKLFFKNLQKSKIKEKEEFEKEIKDLNTNE